MAHGNTLSPPCKLSPTVEKITTCGGTFLWVAQARHEDLGVFMVSWASHCEGRGPDQVQVWRIGSQDVISCDGPAAGGRPGQVLAELIANGTWQYAGNPEEIGLGSPE